MPPYKPKMLYFVSSVLQYLVVTIFICINFFLVFKFHP